MEISRDDKLSKFRSNVADVLKPDHDDNFLLRWLKARNFNLPESEKMLRKHFKWRKQWAVDSILTDYTPPEVLSKYHAGGIIGSDKEGCPLWYLHFGKMDFKGILHSVTASDFIKYVIYLIETSQEQMKKESEIRDTVISEQSFIVNLLNFSASPVTWKPALDMIFELLPLYDLNYPETLKKSYIINAPGVFSTVFAIIKPFIATETAKKIIFLQRDSWQTALLEDIDADVLPAEWGGSRMDESADTNHASMFSVGGTIPESYYCLNKMEPSEDTQSITVPKKSVFNIDLEVTKPKSTISWEFQTAENMDISVCLLFQKYSDEASSAILEVIPLRRVHSYLVPEKGKYLCDEPGKYILQFSNFLWFSPKTLLCRTTIVPPSCSEDQL